MVVQAILDALKRDPASESAWQRAAQELGALLPSCPASQLGELMEGFARIGRDNQAGAVGGAQRALLAVLRGLVHAAAQNRRDKAFDDELLALAVKPIIARVAAALASSGGVARHGDLVDRYHVDPGKLTSALNEMVAAGFVEDVPLPKGADKRARVCRLLPAGQRLAQLHPAPPATAPPPPAPQARSYYEAFAAPPPGFTRPGSVGPKELLVKNGKLISQGKIVKYYIAKNQKIVGREEPPKINMLKINMQTLDARKVGLPVQVLKGS